MRRIILLVILALVQFLHASTSYGCSSDPDSYFDMPEYLDPDIMGRTFSDRKSRTYGDGYINFGRTRQFSMLLRVYFPGNCAVLTMNDSTHRRRSIETESSAYQTYDSASMLFDSGYYDAALSLFVNLRDSLLKSSQSSSRFSQNENYSWTREAASYMVARTALVFSQDRYPGYGNMRNLVNHDMLLFSDSIFSLYLAEYPNGLYSNSARNIKRKILFLSGDREQLNQVLKNAFNSRFPVIRKNSSDTCVDLNRIWEFTNYFNGAIDVAIDCPMLVAYWLLGKSVPTDEEHEALVSRAIDFKDYPGLHEYLLALSYYKRSKYQEIVDLPRPTHPVGSLLWMSQSLLLAKSHSMLGNEPVALGIYERMIDSVSRDALEREIVALLLRTSQAITAFQREKLRLSEKNLVLLAMTGFSERELSMAVADTSVLKDRRQILVDELARRYVITASFESLDGVLKNENTYLEHQFDSIAAELSKNPKSPSSLTRFGEILFESHVTPWNYPSARYNGLVPMMAWFELAPAFSVNIDQRQNDESTLPPMSYFIAVAEESKLSKKRSDWEARALHYIVVARKPGRLYEYTWGMKRWNEKASAEHCKAAFQRLHRLYKDSLWAKATPYYYK